MRFGNAYRLITVHRHCSARFSETTGSLAFEWHVKGVSSYASVTLLPASNNPGAGHATSTSGKRWGAWLLALAVVAPSTSSADAPATQGGAPKAAPSFASSAAAGQAAGTDGAAPPPLTNHPLEYDPVTNEHTAKMTLARTAALDYYNAGKYAQAEAKFREAVEEAQLGFEANDPHIASAKNNLAEFLRNMGRWDEAEQLYKEALDLLERNFGEKHWLFVSALHNLALSYEARGNLAAARTTMERVLALRLAMFGSRHFLYADSLFALGHMMRAVPGQEAAAMRMMGEAVRVLEEAEKLQVNVVLYWLTEIANCHTADGHPDLAAAALRRAVAHLATDRGDEAAAASAVNEQLVEALTAAGRPAEAAEAAEAALAARRKMFGESALVVAQSELRVAQLQLLAAQARGRRGQEAGPKDDSEPAARALQHAEASARISALNVEECSRGSMLSGPPADKLPKRLRASHTLGSAAKLIATLAGVGDPTAAAAAAAAPPVTSISHGEKPAASDAPSKTWSWWPFGARNRASTQGQEAGQQLTDQSPSLSPSPQPQPLTLVTPVAELAAADRYLDQAAAALTSATQAGQELLRSVSSGRRRLPQGLSADELAGLLVEAQLQLLDVLERLALVLQARVAAGQGAAAGAAASDGRGGAGGVGDVVARHRRVLEQQERVAEELLA